MTAQRAAEPVRPPRTWRGLLLPALLAFAILIGLGTWQIQRKAWKEGLIAALRERQAAAPLPLPAPGTWRNFDPENGAYRRVKFTATFANDDETLVFAAPSAFRPDVKGPGYWVFTPARLADGSLVMVNRGFVPEARKAPHSRPDGQISGQVEIVGALRWPDGRHWFTPADDPAHNLWFSPNPVAMIAAKGLAPADGPGAVAVAPFYVEQEAPVPPGGLPQPGKLEASLPDNHLQYALTWYGLAAVLAGVFLSWALSSRASAGVAEAGTQQP